MSTEARLEVINSTRSLVSVAASQGEGFWATRDAIIDISLDYDGTVRVWASTVPGGAPIKLLVNGASYGTE